MNKESDQHVLDYKWTSPRIQQIHPPFYFLLLCRHCFYTDTIEDFETPDNSDYSRWVIKCNKDARNASDPVIQLLSSGIQYDDINFDSAMRIHLLATYLQLLSPPDVIDSYKLGRLFLRIAWLYRERSQKRDSAGSKSPQNENPTKTSEISDLGELVLTGFGEAEELAYAFSSKWGALDKAIQQDVESRFDEKTVPFKEDIDVTGTSIDSLLEQVKVAKTAYLIYVATEENSVAVRASSTGYSMEDTSFIDKLRLMWPLAPSTEKEAMRTAVKYFEQALSTDPRFESMESDFRVSSLSVDLLMRCGEIDSAFGFVRGIHSSCMETRQLYMNKLKEPDMKPDRKKKIQVLIKRNNATLDCALDLGTELMDKLVERELPRIEAIIKKHPKSSSKALEEALVAAGIPNGIINHIKNPKNKNDLAQVLLRK